MRAPPRHGVTARPITVEAPEAVPVTRTGTARPSIATRSDRHPLSTVPAFGGVAFALSVGLIWARLYLQRQNVVEMLSGTLLGLGGGVATAWWP